MNSWGVYPLILEEKANTDELFADAIEGAKKLAMSTTETLWL